MMSMIKHLLKQVRKTEQTDQVTQHESQFLTNLHEQIKKVGLSDDGILIKLTDGDEENISTTTTQTSTDTTLSEVELKSNTDKPTSNLSLDALTVSTHTQENIDTTTLPSTPDPIPTSPITSAPPQTRCPGSLAK